MIGRILALQFHLPASTATSQVNVASRRGRDAIAFRSHGSGSSSSAMRRFRAKETILNVPRFDFNWQLFYYLDMPKLLPKGTRIECTAHFDNSANHPGNPDPTSEVRWGASRNPKDVFPKKKAK